MAPSPTQQQTITSLLGREGRERKGNGEEGAIAQQQEFQKTEVADVALEKDQKWQQMNGDKEGSEPVPRQLQRRSGDSEGKQQIGGWTLEEEEIRVLRGLEDVIMEAKVIMKGSR